MKKKLVGGFSSSHLNFIYPSYKTLICTSELERLSKEVQFSEQNVILQEMESYPCANFVSILLERFILYENQYDHYNHYQKLYVNTSNIFNSIIDEGMENFSHFIQNYLIKLPTLK